MFSDKKLIVVIEYIIGFSLLMAVVPLFADPNPDWSDARWWAYLLFVVGFGLTLVSCATAMKQRIELARRVSKIEKTLEEMNCPVERPVSPPKQEQPIGQADAKHAAFERFAASLS